VDGSGVVSVGWCGPLRHVGMSHLPTGLSSILIVPQAYSRLRAMKGADLDQLKKQVHRAMVGIYETAKR
jgi:hypothetical protein